MSIKFIPMYTQCGRSVNTLKGYAKKLKKTNPNLSHIAALNTIARKYGYSDWNEIINRKNIFRDYFFAILYQDKGFEPVKNCYIKYIKDNNKLDSSDSFREFIVHQFSVIEKVSLIDPETAKKNVENNDYLPDLNDLLMNYGHESLLPQNLTDYLLNILIDEYYVSEKISGFLFVILAILSYEQNTYEIILSIEDLYEHMELYYIALEMEYINRRKVIVFERPTIDNLFDPNRSISFEFMPEEKPE
ncbi:MAG: glyoxalase superfamily protein [Candidatus Muiribacteriota bacterium]